MLTFKEHVIPRQSADVITLLCEADYMNMLPAHYRLFFADEFAEAQQWARKVLKKDDRIVWFLRHVRDQLVKEFVVSKDDPELETLVATSTRADRKISKHTFDRLRFEGNVSLRDLKRSLEHYYSLPIQKIQALVLNRQSTSEVIQAFDEMELDWKEAREGLITSDQLEGDETIAVKVDGEWNWWLLPRGGCEVEGSAMGHCGNVPSQKPGDKIYSLRKTVRLGSDVAYEPALTFIVDKDGWLGESKGRGNDKPAEKYHLAIVKLLQSGLIAGNVGGGYLPGSNFAWDDLSDANKKAVQSKNPKFIGDLYSITKEQIQANPSVIPLIDEAIWDFPFKLKLVGDKVKTVRPVSIIEIIELVADRNTIDHVKKYIDAPMGMFDVYDGGARLSDVFNYRIHDKEEKMIIAALSPESKKEFENSDLDLEDYISQNEPDIESAINMAMDDAISEAMGDAWVSAIQEWAGQIVNALGDSFEWLGKSWEPGIIRGDLGDAMKLVKEADGYVNDYIESRSPKNYDTRAIDHASPAQSSFSDQLSYRLSDL